MIARGTRCTVELVGSTVTVTRGAYSKETSVFDVATIESLKFVRADWLVSKGTLKFITATHPSSFAGSLINRDGLTLSFWPTQQKAFSDLHDALLQAMRTGSN